MVQPDRSGRRRRRSPREPGERHGVTGPRRSRPEGGHGRGASSTAARLGPAAPGSVPRRSALGAGGGSGADSPGGLSIPHPPKVLHVNSDGLRRSDADRPGWRYDQERKRGGYRSYFGRVETIHGDEAERLRDELASVTRDLLDWVTQQHIDDASGEDGATA